MRGTRHALLLVLLLHAGGAAAIDLERLVMPGKLVAGHADLESDCNKCHERFDRDAQTRLCLDCHDEVAADRTASHGFHGRLSTARDAACAVCHTEHRGRDADIVGLDRAAFDHQWTDFHLEGAHRGVACDACHEKGVALRDAPSRCVDCHAEVEPHGGALGDDCARCHGSDAWRRIRFDHASTGFALAGKHTEASCGACHPAERWKDTPDDCVACHRADDAHRGRFGLDCKGCHEPAGWKGQGFDHGRDTRFALTGAHRQAPCASCHSGDPRKDAPPMDCFGCHRADDDHRGANGKDCRACHGTDRWSRVAFDHARDTKFPLRGRHREVRCESCHAGPPRQVETSSACVACHAAVDVHRGQEGRECSLCHDSEGWRGVRFDHDLTRFPLLGLHAVATCEQCHATQEFQDADTDCVACHRGDDAHQGSLGFDCHACHNPNDWRIWSFDHGLRTRFELDGAHEGLSCGSCHHGPFRPESIRSDCAACHLRDDAHRGALGQDCGRCHESSDWREVRVR